MNLVLQTLHALWKSWLGAIAFYTVLPIPPNLSLSFQKVSRLAPTIGLLIGGILWLLDTILVRLDLPPLTCSATLVVLWILLTGGLHLDGAMDSADGLAVMDPNRRLEVMADSRTGAFGVMAAVAIVILKTVTLSDLSLSRGWAILLAAAWGRWGQQMAIACYPYLKPTGKGAFHKAALPSPWACIPSLIGLLAIHASWSVLVPGAAIISSMAFCAGGAIACIVGYWFKGKLGGHTGDTYGAVVEITETLFLMSFILIEATITSQFNS